MVRFMVAIDEKRGIANDHGIPWIGKIPGDQEYYRAKINDGSTMVMGYGLYKELTAPYPGGINYVATSNPSEKLRDGFEPITDAHEFIRKNKGDVWDLGGAGLYGGTFDLADELYITQLKGDFHCTKFFPDYEQDFEMVKESPPKTENGITYTFQVWKRKPN